MRRWTIDSALLASLLLLASAAAAQPAKLLFEDHALLPVTLQAPLAALANRRDERAAQPATLSTASEQLSVTVAPRGITRRSKDICAFPPLRLQFPAAPPPTSLFSGQRRLKLVTHCRTPENHQQYVLLEYAAYRMLNLLTPLSFRARLLAVDYRDTGRGSGFDRLAFLIEDVDDVARRNGLVRTTAGDVIARDRLDPRQAGLAAMFQYMIGNLDWGMRAGPEGEGCCHNFRLLSRPGSTVALPVPYDFDFSGLVDAPYATPPELIPVSSVRVRRYRGYCQHNGEALAAAREMRVRQADLLGVLANLPGLNTRSLNKANGYLAPFFREIATDDLVRSKILASCVR